MPRPPIHPLKLIIGANIRQKRRLMKLKQIDVAAQVGMATTTLSFIENGITWPQFETLKALASVLNVRVEQFFDLHLPASPITPEQALRCLADALHVIMTIEYPSSSPGKEE